MLKKVALMTAALSLAGAATGADWVSTHEQSKKTQVQSVKKVEKTSQAVKPASNSSGAKKLNPQPLPPG